MDAIDSALVFSREVFKTAIDTEPKLVVLGHNHPGVGSRPSQDDIAVTSRH